MSPQAPKTYAPGWQEIHQATQNLAQAIKDDGPWHTIAAVTRGGMVPAAILAAELGVRRIETIAIASYDGQRQGTPRILKACEDSGDGWLVVDDIVDTGKTAGIVRELFPEACFVTIYAKPDGAPFIDHCAAEIPQNMWVVFPWEKPDEPVTDEPVTGEPGMG